MLLDVLARLVDEHEAHFPGSRQRPRVIRAALDSRRLSDIGRATLDVDGTRVELFIKFHKHPTSPESSVAAKAAREFDTLRWLAEAITAVPGCAVARPVAYFPEWKAVVTERAEGENLYELLNRPLRTLLGPVRRQAAGWCERAGAWLRGFQTVTARGETRPFDADAFRAESETLLARCRALGLAPMADHVAAWMAPRLDRLAGTELAVVGQHPDFQPQNVLIAPDCVTVIDFTSFKYGDRYHDVACFLTFLDSRSKHPCVSRAHLRELRDGFLRGYGMFADDDPLLRLHRVKAMLDYCTRLLLRRPGRAGARAMVQRLGRHWAERHAIPGVLA
jgi:aminoglycoside phosphotransferase (APT) family kinase protein